MTDNGRWIAVQGQAVEVARRLTVLDAEGSIVKSVDGRPLSMPPVALLNEEVLVFVKIIPRKENSP